MALNQESIHDLPRGVYKYQNHLHVGRSWHMTAHLPASPARPRPARERRTCQTNSELRDRAGSKGCQVPGVGFAPPPIWIGHAPQLRLWHPHPPPFLNRRQGLRLPSWDWKYGLLRPSPQNPKRSDRSREDEACPRESLVARRDAGPRRDRLVARLPKHVV